MRTRQGRFRPISETESQKIEAKEGSKCKEQTRPAAQSVRQEWKQGGVQPRRDGGLRARSGSSLLFQANFTGSNLSAAPDTERAAAICLEISPLIGSMEKKTEKKQNKKTRPPHCRL